MEILLRPFLLMAICYLIFPLKGRTQQNKLPVSFQLTGTSPEKYLFGSDEVLEITLSGNIRELVNDRNEKSTHRHMLLLYKEEDREIPIPVEVKTRGHFRKLKGNCDYPPLLIQFSKNDDLKSSIFKGQDKLKMVMPCKDDQYVILEWLAYKIYNLLTPKSFSTRLVRVKLVDSKKKKASSPLFGILLETEKDMAKRNGAVSVSKKIQPWQTEPHAFLVMAVFEYLIGNTDWSVQYLQNIKLVADDPNAVPTAVPYDFDHSGLVNAPYALPPEALKLNSVRERRYRGFCVPDMKQFDDVVALYNRLKKDIYNVFINCALLDAKYKKISSKYLDEFYKTMINTKEWQREFSYPCDKNGTGNIVIKGLRED